jgi:hypothetical protein
MIGRPPADHEPEAEPANHEDDVGLLIDQPAHDLRALPRFVREKRRVRGEVDENRVRLGEVALRRLEHRCRAHRIDARVLVAERPAREDVDRGPLVLTAELREQEAHLVAVAGRGIVVELHVA